MRFEFVCDGCRRHELFFVRPPAAPRCHHGRRWWPFARLMTRI